MKRFLRIAVVLLLCSAPAFSQDQKDLGRARLYEPFIAEASVKYNVDANLLWTVAYLESRFRPHVISPKGAMGLMQLIPATAARYGLANPYDPKQSIDAAAQYLRDLLNRFDGRSDLVLAAYNAGEQAVIAFRDGRTITLPNGKVINPAGRKTGGVPPYSETENYVSSGMAVYGQLVTINTDAKKPMLDNKNAPDLPDLSQLKQKSVPISGSIESKPKIPGKQSNEKNRSSSIYF